LKTIVTIITLLFVISFSTTTTANEHLSLGAGLGFAYSGIGLNIAQQSEQDMKYLSYGCVGNTVISGTICGAGVGWITSRFFDNSNKHALGIYYGVIGVERQFFDEKKLYGLGFGYHYYLNGIGKSGSNIGLSVVSNNKSEQNAVILELGYQF